MAAMNIAQEHLHELFSQSFQGDDPELPHLLARQIIQEDEGGQTFLAHPPAAHLKPDPEQPRQVVHHQPQDASDHKLGHQEQERAPTAHHHHHNQQVLSSHPKATPSDTALFAGIPKGQNAVAVVWRGDYDATFNVYANNGPYQPGLGEAFKSVHVKAGATANIELPPNFSGRVQLMSGGGKADDCATWGEIAFQQWQDLTFYDVSLIRGTNAGLSMRASDGSSKAEIPANILEQAPEHIKVKDSGGKMVIKDTEGYDGGINEDAIDWLHHTVKLSDAYARNFENEATHSTTDTHMVLEFSV